MNHVQNIKAHLDQLKKHVSSLEKKWTAIQTKMESLKEMGTLNARPYWLNNKQDQPAYLYLAFTQENAKKENRQKIRYVGKNSFKTKEALAAIERYQEINRLIDQQSQILSEMAFLDEKLAALNQQTPQTHSQREEWVPMEEPEFKILNDKKEIAKMNLHQQADGFFITFKIKASTQTCYLCTQRDQTKPRFFKNMDRLLLYLQEAASSVSQCALYFEHNKGVS